MLDVHLQDAVLGGWVPAVGPEEMLHGVVVHTVGPDDAGTKREQDRGALDAQRVRGTGERPLVERRSARQVADHAHRLGLALKRGPSGRRLDVCRAVAVQETDDVVAAKVRGEGHRRAPIAVGANQDILMDERRIARDERTDAGRVIAADRVRELHRVDEPCPARRVVAPCEHELRVGQLRGRGAYRFGMVLAQLGDCRRIAGADGAQELLSLAMQLFRVGPNR